MLLPITGLLRGRSRKRTATMGLTAEIGYHSGIHLLALLASASSGLVGRVHILLDTESLVTDIVTTRAALPRDPPCLLLRTPLVSWTRSPPSGRPKS